MSVEIARDATSRQVNNVGIRERRKEVREKGRKGEMER